MGNSERGSSRRVGKVQIGSSAVVYRWWPFVEALFQGRTPWVDSACADCPGFLVPGATPALECNCAWEPQIVPFG